MLQYAMVKCYTISQILQYAMVKCYTMSQMLQYVMVKSCSIYPGQMLPYLSWSNAAV